MNLFEIVKSLEGENNPTIESISGYAQTFADALSVISSRPSLVCISKGSVCTLSKSLDTAEVSFMKSFFAALLKIPTESLYFVWSAVLSNPVLFPALLKTLHDHIYIPTSKVTEIGQVVKWISELSQRFPNSSIVDQNGTISFSQYLFAPVAYQSNIYHPTTLEILSRTYPADRKLADWHWNLKWYRCRCQPEELEYPAMGPDEREAWLEWEIGFPKSFEFLNIERQRIYRRKMLATAHCFKELA